MLKEEMTDDQRRAREVLPSAPRPLTGSGTTWEWDLCEQGYNDWPPEKQVGVIVGFFMSSDGGVTVDVDFNGHVAQMVYRDEIVFVNPLPVEAKGTRKPGALPVRSSSRTSPVPGTAPSSTTPHTR